jgi:predicted glutamine amidotransferase
MCGLIYVRRTDGGSAAETVEAAYKQQKSRGTRGFGYVAIGQTVEVKRAESESVILKQLKTEKSSEVLFHHREPTSTPNYVDITHPIRVEHESLGYTYYLIHNGIISNDTERKAEHEKKGFAYSTTVKIEHRTRNHTYTAEQFNDSEALAIDFARYAEGKAKTIQARGSIAFICLQVEKLSGRPLALYAARNNSSPLRTYENESIFALISEGGSKSLPVNTLWRYDYASGRMTESPLILPDIERQSFDRFYPDTYSSGYDWNYYDDMDYCEGDWEECAEELRHIDEAITIAHRLGDHEEMQTLISDREALERRMAELQSQLAF